MVPRRGMGRCRGPLGHEAIDAKNRRLEREVADVKAGVGEPAAPCRWGGVVASPAAGSARERGRCCRVAPAPGGAAPRSVQRVPPCPCGFGDNFSNRISCWECGQTEFGRCRAEVGRRMPKSARHRPKPGQPVLPGRLCWCGGAAHAPGARRFPHHGGYGFPCPRPNLRLQPLPCKVVVRLGREAPPLMFQLHLVPLLADRGVEEGKQSPNFDKICVDLFRPNLGGPMPIKLEMTSTA